jgi:hypothetical protein
MHVLVMPTIDRRTPQGAQPFTLRWIARSANREIAASQTRIVAPVPSRRSCASMPVQPSDPRPSRTAAVRRGLRDLMLTLSVPVPMFTTVPFVAN